MSKGKPVIKNRAKNFANTSDSVEDLVNAVIDDEADTNVESNRDQDDDEDEGDDDIDDDDDEMHLRYEFAMEEFHDADRNKDNRVDIKEFARHKHMAESDEEEMAESDMGESDMSSNLEHLVKVSKHEFVSFDKSKDGFIGLNEVRQSLDDQFCEC